jgi:dihydrofolate reductase
VAQIDVRTTPEGEGWAFQVTVSERSSQTSHRVTMGRNTYQQLTGEVCSPGELVRRSFEFLLEREPKESILREFEITVISRYFPDYEREISKRIRP